ncbi:hypothetical protein D9619_011435 [Psilocybe cf. subviscida]|uniref:Uncharacterized protein n=1 Tax=Psilocybe cf. subviscida TaxID=2480587 RepID=A0A8H5F9F3_9AGAR|nr:hypothetical protein D9619_011435 [Psilocybe cf. subviscida]
MVPTALPRDVLATIVDAGPFRRHELCAISLVSPHLRHEAQRRLFRDPGPHSINVLSGTDSESLTTTRMFLEAVASSPDVLAPMVRRYRIAISWFNFHARFDREQRQLQHTLFNCISRALPLMVNLKELRYHETLELATQPVSGPPPSIWPVLKRCSFRLQTFRCSYIGTSSRSALAIFLRSQSDIKELWLNEAPQAQAINTIALLQNVFKDVCPSLVSLGCMAEIVASMLPGRHNLKHISWEQNNFATVVKYNADLVASTNISNVELFESLRCGPPLSLVCDLFTNLVVLKTCERDILKKLRGLPRLRVLIGDLEGGLGIPRSLANEGKVIRQAFTHIPSLDCLECHRQYGIERGRKYIIDRDTKVVTIYTIPRVAHLANAEGREELLRKLFVQVDGDHIFERSFNGD